MCRLVCGQDAKSHKARSEPESVLKRLLLRERKRQTVRTTGLIVGGANDLISLVPKSSTLYRGQAEDVVDAVMFPVNAMSSIRT